MTNEPQLDQHRALGRRGLLTTASLATFAALGTSLVPSTASAAPIGDGDILNFALNLEYLEAEFYLRAATGKGLPGPDRRHRQPWRGHRRPQGDASIHQGLSRICRRDRRGRANHVLFLRSALGGAAVARPAIDLDQASPPRHGRPGLISGSQKFDAFANETNFLLAAFIFEDVGVTAYKGAARLITSKDVLEAAAGLLAVEAYHAGRDPHRCCTAAGLFQPRAQISDARDSLDGSGDRDQGIGTRQGNIVPTDANGLAFCRTTTGAEHRLSRAVPAPSFGFFPNRLNGASSSACDRPGRGVGAAPARPRARHTPIAGSRQMPASSRQATSRQVSPTPPAGTVTVTTYSRQ